MRLIALLATAALLAGCTMTPKPAVTPPPAPHLTPPSQIALAACERPVVLKKGAATQQQVEIAWSVDDDHLIECARRHQILANYIKRRDGALAGKGR